MRKSVDDNTYLYFSMTFTIWYFRLSNPEISINMQTSWRVIHYIVVYSQHFILALYKIIHILFAQKKIMPLVKDYAPIQSNRAYEMRQQKYSLYFTLVFHVNILY